MNFSFPMHAMISVFPTGDYKMTAHYTNKEGKSLWNMSGVASLMTSNRDTFG